MKKSAHLVSIARKLEIKYLTKTAIDAELIRPRIQEAIQTALVNASSHTNLGIWNFKKMQQEDNCSLSFDVTRNNKTVTVTNIQTSPAEAGTRYQDLAPQIKGYLEKYLEIYPSKVNGDSVDYSNFTVKCDYSAPTQLPIATR